MVVMKVFGWWLFLHSRSIVIYYTRATERKKNEYKKHLAMRFLGFYYITRIVTSHTYLIYYIMVLLHRIIVGLLQKGTFWSKSVDFSNEWEAKINCFKKIPQPIREGILRTFMSMTVYIKIDVYSINSSILCFKLVKTSCFA